MTVSQRPTERDLAASTASPTTVAATRTRRSARRTPPEARLILNRYRLERRLGTGGFATVWMARDERLEREVAVKVLPRERIVGGRFEREARAAARLSHPGIVTLYEAAVDDEGAYLVSELVHGQTLHLLLDAGRLSDRGVVEIGIALCDALTHAHAQSVVHRDVKPSNILVPDRPASALQAAKLTDFGVARVIGGDSLTRTGDVVGTAVYMAPEQAEGREAGAPADLYSLSVVLYEALTGLNPLRGLPEGQRARRLATHLPPVRRHRRDLPRDLARVVDLALRPRPRERGTVAELRAGLYASLDQVGDTPGVVSGPWRPRPGRADLRGDERSYEPEARWAEPPPDDHAWTGEAPPASAQAPAGSSARWPARAAAGVSAALLAAWLTSKLAAHPPVPPPLAGLLAAVAVSSLPRLGWLALTAAGVGGLAGAGDGGAALVLAAGALLPVLLMLRQSSRWPLPGLAVILGAIGLAGAWPAVAARMGRSRPWQRAMLGAVGWVWLQLAGALVGSGLYMGLPASIPSRTVWSSSLYETVHHVLPAALSSARLLPAVAWAIGALTLPWLAAPTSGHGAGRSAPAAHIWRTGLWSTGLTSSTVVLLAIAGAHPAIGLVPALLGVLAGWLVALFVPERPVRREARSARRAGASRDVTRVA